MLKALSPFHCKSSTLDVIYPMGKRGKCKGQHCAKVQKKVFQSFTKYIFVLRIKKACEAVDNLDVCNVTGLRSTAVPGSNPAMFIHNSPPYAAS